MSIYGVKGEGIRKQWHIFVYDLVSARLQTFSIRQKTVSPFPIQNFTLVQIDGIADSTTRMTAMSCNGLTPMFADEKMLAKTFLLFLQCFSKTDSSLSLKHDAVCKGFNPFPNDKI